MRGGNCAARVFEQIRGTNPEGNEFWSSRPFPSGLFLAYDAGQPLHVVAAIDEASKTAFIITAYQPSLEIVGVSGNEIELTNVTFLKKVTLIN